MCHSTQCRRHARQRHGHVDTFISHGASRQDSEKHSLRLEVGLRVGTRLLLQQHPHLMKITILKVSGRRMDMMCPHSSAQHAHESVGFSGHAQRIRTTSCATMYQRKPDQPV